MGRVLRGWALAQLGDPHQGVREITERASPPRAAPARGWTTRTTSRCSPRRTCAPGELDAGLAAVAEALELARRERSLFYEPELHRLDGRAARRPGETDAAEARLRQGLARAREQRSVMLELRIATELARFVTDPTCAAEARGWVAAALARFEEGHGTRDLREAALPARRLGRSGDHARRREHEHQRPERDAVDDEDQRRVAASASAAGTRSTRSRR